MFPTAFTYFFPQTCQSIEENKSFLPSYFYINNKVPKVILYLARQINCRLLNFSSASIFKVLQSCPQLVNILTWCQTAWIWVRR